MKSGAVIFAFNNGTTDYAKIAAWNARRVNQWLDLPVTLITDQAVDPGPFDQVIQCSPTVTGSMRSDHRDVQKSPWYNWDRCDAFDFTPYDRTLLLDADYVVNSRDLLACIHGTGHFLYHTRAWDLARATLLHDLNSFGRFALPMTWATVVIFSQDTDTAHVFQCWRMIRDHWQHYRNLYGITDTVFRNDHALTIALSIVEGHVWPKSSIPWHLATVMPDTGLEYDHDDHTWTLRYQDNRLGVSRQILRDRDFHAMNKIDLERCIG